MISHKILNIAPLDTHLQNTLSRQLGISKVLAQILINRGIKNLKEAEEFLSAKLEYLLDPFSFTDMHKAVKLIHQAVNNREKVMICGDYDVDGITSITLFKNTLSKMGLHVEHYIPHRIKDGYGLNKKAVEIAKQKKIKLLITADCGTSNHSEIKALRDNHIEVIITDHHEAADTTLPPASVMINPKIKDCSYKFKDLAGVGVAYKLCQALTNKNLAEDLDLVSLGTIADVVPLKGENRIIAKEGLSLLTQAKRTGIRALVEISRINGRQINSTFVSFILGPRINASGRIDTAETALNLLMSEDKKEADMLAKSIDVYNRQRQKIESKILEEAQEIIEREINFKEHKIIVIAKEGWHEGVLGIVAAKLTDRYYRPTIVISLTEDLCRGSGRSIKNFHLFQALLECKEHLKNFGGHSHAVGLSVNKDSIEEFRKKINRLAHEKLLLEDLIPSIEIDMGIDLCALNEQLVDELKVLEPFGTGNPEPLFYTRNLKLKGEPQILSRETLKFWVSDGDITYQAIGFGMSNFKESLKSADSFDLVYIPRIDSWQGETAVLLEARDIFFR